MAAKSKQASEKKSQKASVKKKPSKAKSVKKTKSPVSANKTAKSFSMVRHGTSVGDLEAARLEAINEKNHLEAVMEALPIGVSIVDEKGGNIQANKAFEQIWGGPRPPTRSVKDYVKYKAWWPDTGKEVKPDEWASAQAVKKGETVTNQLLEIQRFDGTRRFVLNSAAPILDGDGKIIGSAVAIRDITEFRRAEESLRISEERYRSLFNKMTEAFALHEIICDKKGRPSDYRFLEANPAFETLTSLKAKDIIGKTVKEVMHDIEPFWIETYGQVALTGKSKHFENYSKALGKHYEVFAYSPAPMQLAVLFIDITERLRMRAEIEDMAKFPAENPFPVLRLSRKGEILYSNTPGKIFLEQWNWEIGRKAPQNWCYLIRTSLQGNRYLVEKIKCGGKTYSVTIAPIQDGGYVNLYGRDITVQEQIKEALRKSLDELEVKVKQRTVELSQTVAALQKEIDERKSTEKKLKERTRNLDAFFSNTITPLVILDKNFNFVRVNKAYADACQRDISEFAGHNHFKFYPHEENEQIFKKVVRTKQPYQALAKPFSYPDHPEWGITYWDWTLVPVLDEDREVELLIFSLNDVTNRKRAEEVVKAERQRLRDVLETLPVYICLMTPDYYMPFANRVFRENFGYHPDKKCHEFLFNRTEPCEICETYSVLKTNKPHEWEWIGPNGHNYYIFDFPFKDTDGSILILEMGIDITELKRAEKRSRVTNNLLEQFATKTSRKEYLDSVVEIIRDWSGCRHIGIRLTNADGYIPYESYTGFDKEFLSLENRLCLKTDSCICIRAISQKPQPQDSPLLTAKGSLQSNNSLEFIKSLPENEKKQYRGTCMGFGFASLAVIPISYRDKILGAIHLADESQNKVPMETVVFLEDMATMIGEAVHRFNVEESLRLNEKRLLEAQKLAHLGNWELDIPANRLWWSDEVYRIFGLEPRQFDATYDAFLSHVHPDDRSLVEESVNKALYDGQPYDIDHRIIKPDGSERIVNEKAEVIYGSNHKPVKMAGTVYDITDKKKAEDEIRENQRALRALAAELQITEERERRLIAQDLHDSIGQILAFSGRELKTIQKSLPEKTAKSILEIAKQLDIAVEQSRNLSFDLSPSTLYDLGFEVAVEDLVDRMSKERKIQCRFENCRSPKPLSDNVKVLLYRSVRELLINAAKHSNACLVKVSLLRSGSEISIQVEDDGRGFDTSILDGSSTKTKGFGIFSIRERLSHIGGRVKIESAKDKGTRAVLIAPLDIEKENKQETSL